MAQGRVFALDQTAEVHSNRSLSGRHDGPDKSTPIFINLDKLTVERQDNLTTVVMGGEKVYIEANQRRSSRRVLFE